MICDYIVLEYFVRDAEHVVEDDVALITLNVGRTNPIDKGASIPVKLEVEKYDKNKGDMPDIDERKLESVAIFKPGSRCCVIGCDGD